MISLQLRKPMPQWHLLVIQVEPRCRARGIDYKGMRRIVLHVLNSRREDRLLPLPALLAAAIVSRINSYFSRFTLNRLHHHRHHQISKLTLLFIP